VNWGEEGGRPIRVNHKIGGGEKSGPALKKTQKKSGVPLLPRGSLPREGSRGRSSADVCPLEGKEKERDPPIFGKINFPFQANVPEGRQRVAGGSRPTCRVSLKQQKRVLRRYHSESGRHQQKKKAKGHSPVTEKLFGSVVSMRRTLGDQADDHGAKKSDKIRRGTNLLDSPHSKGPGEQLQHWGGDRRNRYYKPWGIHKVEKEKKTNKNHAKRNKKKTEQESLSPAVAPFHKRKKPTASTSTADTTD